MLAKKDAGGGKVKLLLKGKKDADHQIVLAVIGKGYAGKNELIGLTQTARLLYLQRIGKRYGEKHRLQVMVAVGAASHYTEAYIYLCVWEGVHIN